MRSERGWWWLAPVVGLQLASFAVAPLSFEFPLNDDWAWAHCVTKLVQEGQLELPDYAAMSLVGHTLYGALWSLAFGLGYTTLHAATASLWLAAAAGTFWLLRELEVASLWAALGSASVVFNPIVVLLSRSFMTDVPFLAFSVLATAAYARGLQREELRWAWVGALLASYATLIRQLGVVTAVPPLAVWILVGGYRRPAPGRWLFALVFPLAVCTAFLVWFYGLRGPTLAAGRHGFVGPLRLGAQTPLCLWTIALYLGLFLSPLAIASIPDRCSPAGNASGTKLFAALLVVIAGLGIVLYRTVQLRMPLLGNYLSGPGLGPCTLPDDGQLGYSHPLAWPYWFWWLGNALAWLGAAGVVTALFQPWLEKASPNGFLAPRAAVSAAPAVTLLTLALSVATLVALDHIYDRYLLPLLPLAAGLLLRSAPARPRFAVLAASLLVVAASWSVQETAIHLSWNQARWDALHDLINRQSIAPARIDGGFEFNASLAPDRLPAQAALARASNPWVLDDEYVLAFAPRTGYQVVGRWPFWRGWCRAPGTLLVLHRR